jgi:TetR/AcrR family transcriptional regulator
MAKTNGGVHPPKELLILDAAQRRFSSYGYAKTTMDEIADDVGMAKASLYYYYPTKEEVFRSVIRREQEIFLAGLRQIMEQPSGAVEKLRSFALLRVELTERLLVLNEINQLQRDDVHSIFFDLFQTFGEQEERCVIRILNEGVKAGELAIPQTRAAAMMIQHVLQGLRLRLFKAHEHASGKKDLLREWRCDSLLFIESVLHGMIKTK